MSGFSLNLVLQHNRVSIRWHMTKLQIKFDRITFYGGIYLVNWLFWPVSLGKVVNDTLDLRSTARNGYQWDEIVKSLFDIYLCGGDHIEDITSLMPCLSQAPGSHIPSSDTIGRGIKQLETDNITYTAKSGKTYTFNTNELLNDLLMKLNMAVRLFKRGQFLDVDFDHQFIPTEKHDATLLNLHFHRATIKKPFFCFNLL